MNEAAKKLGAFGVTILGFRLNEQTGFLREFTPVGAGMTTQEKGVNLCTDSRNAYFSTSFPRRRESIMYPLATYAGGIKSSPVSCLIERGPPRGHSRDDVD